MQKIITWLKKGNSLKEYVREFPFLLFITIVLALLGVFLEPLLLPYLPLGTPADAVDMAVAGHLFDIVIAVILGPFIEEFLFRVLPFILVIFVLRLFKLRGKAKVEGPALSAWVVITSIIFGFAHGEGNIFVQGISGAIYACVFLRWSAFGTSKWKGWLASSTLHGSMNGVLIALAALLS